jgi:ATP-dependent DNA helicase RecG
VPNNPLIAESLYLTRYIEKAGSGTQRMIELCREAGLPEPQFEQRSSSFVITLWRDWLTAQVLAGLGLNDRQMKAVTHVKAHGRITNTDYRELTGTIMRTASRDLEDMVTKRVLNKVGTTGRNAHYVLTRKLDIKRSNGT